VLIATSISREINLAIHLLISIQGGAMRLSLKSIILALGLALMSTSVRADDNSIAQEISQRLEQKKQESLLQGFRISMKVEDGTVYMGGHVANESQRDVALDVARRVAGVKLVVNDLKVGSENSAPISYAPQPVQQASAAGWGNRGNGGSAGLEDPAARNSLTNPASRFRAVSQNPVPDPQPVSSAYQQVASYSPVMAPPSQPMARPMPAAPYGGGSPIRMAQAVGCADGNCGGTTYGGSYGGAEYGGAEYGGTEYGGTTYGGSQYGGPAVEYGGGYNAGGGISHEQPQLPGYAWPSYASYPNYGALTYPRQYSPQAWPYIGPFYPYPQVPLGWRKVTLEWDDGWWMLDFAAK
jgi:hypothetical protein